MWRELSRYTEGKGGYYLQLRIRPGFCAPLIRYRSLLKCVDRGSKRLTRQLGRDCCLRQPSTGQPKVRHHVTRAVSKVAIRHCALNFIHAFECNISGSESSISLWAVAVQHGLRLLPACYTNDYKASLLFGSFPSHHGRLAPHFLCSVALFPNALPLLSPLAALVKWKNLLVWELVYACACLLS